MKLSLLFGAVASAISLEGSINKGVLPLSIQDLTQTSLKLIRNAADTATTSLKADGRFVFNNVTDGTYSLELESVPFISDAIYRVDIKEEIIEVHKVFKGHDLNDLGPKVEPLQIEVMRPNYVYPREEFSVLGMLKSPMMLMSIASLAMVFILPYVTENLDPEDLKQIQDNQVKSAAAMDKVQNFDMAAYMAGSSSSSSSTEAKKRK